MRTLATIALLAAACLGAGCSDSDDERLLVGPQWVLRTAIVDGEEVYPSFFINETTVVFEAATFSGADGCNGFGGRYDVAGISIVPGEQWSTDAVCLVGGYTPLHFEAPFDFEIRGETLTVTTASSLHVYDAR